MATYTTNFSSWSDFEDVLTAAQDFEASPQNQSIGYAVENLIYTLFFDDPYNYTFSATSITAYYYGATAHLYGSNFDTASATVTRTDITDGTYTLMLKGSVNIGGVNPTGTITSLDFSGAGYSEHAVGQLPLDGSTGEFTSWSATYPTSMGSVTFLSSGKQTVYSSGTVKTDYSSISVTDSSGHSASLSGLKYSVTDYSDESVDYLALMHNLLGGNDLANGSTSNNELYTFAGNDTLDGKAGADTMVGGVGNDVYIVDNIDDMVVEEPDQGTDHIKSSIDYLLPDNFEKLTLTGTAAIVGTGNNVANIITGNAGNNTLDGAAGVDTLIGGLGNDTYLVDLTATGTLQDIITEAASAGIDTVVLRGSADLATAATLTLAATLEHLDASATGSTKLNLTGNAAANILTGNAADNTLTGGAGADSLVGGLGDDSYGVDNLLDKITENADEGTDSVLSSVTHTLAANLEHLTLTGAAAINGTGNELDNILTGNTGANILNGGIGADTMTGGAGADTLNGGEGNDLLDGGLGKDVLNGGAGDDSFIFSTAPNATTNSDTIADFTSGQDTILLGNLIFTALGAAGDLNPDFFHVGTSAHDADDHIVFNAATGALYYDPDGTGAAAQVQFATLTGAPLVAATDFVVGF